MKERDCDQEFAKVQAFAEDFRVLLRKYMPDSPGTTADCVTLLQMQDLVNIHFDRVWASSGEYVR